MSKTVQPLTPLTTLTSQMLATPKFLGWQLWSPLWPLTLSWRRSYYGAVSRNPDPSQMVPCLPCLVAIHSCLPSLEAVARDILLYWTALKIFGVQIWRILASGYLAMAWASSHGRAGNWVLLVLWYCPKDGSLQCLLYLIIPLALFGEERCACGLVAQRIVWGGAVVDYYFGKRWEPVHFSDFVLVPFSSRAFDIRQRARHHLWRGRWVFW